MKKLLILAVLALGLWTSPAMADIVFTVDFTENITPVQGLSPISGYDTWDFCAPNSSFGLAFEVAGNPSEKELGFDSWYQTADGLTIDLQADEKVYVSFANWFWPEMDQITLRLRGKDVIWTLLPYWLIQPIVEDGFIEFNLADSHVPHFDPSSTVVSMLFMNYGDTPLTLTLSSVEFRYTGSVPVPAAVWLLGTGVAGVAALRRKFK